MSQLDASHVAPCSDGPMAMISTRRELLAGAALTAIAPLVSVASGSVRKAGYAGSEAHYELLEGFRNPPQQARPHVWWHWMTGNVTAEGAKLDLDWMSRIGVGGIHLFSGGQMEPTVVPEPLPFMSAEWCAVFRSSVLRARSAALNVVIAGSPGWSQTGGPWVPAANGMKKYVWSEIAVTGGTLQRIELPPLPDATGPFLTAPREGGIFGAPLPSPYRAQGGGPVIAFPTDDEELGDEIRYRTAGDDIARLDKLPTDLSEVVKLPLTGEGLVIDIELGELRTIHGLTAAIRPVVRMELLSSEDGREFRSIRRVDPDGTEKPAPQQTIALPPTRARVIRIRFEPPPPPHRLPDLPPEFPKPQLPKEFEIRQLRLESGPRVDHFEAKAGFQAIVSKGTTPQNETPGIAPSSIINLTSLLQSDGTIEWNPPEGRWTILRLGWSLTGQVNGPAEPEATGLEVDKLDAQAVRAYLDGLFALYREKCGVPLGRDGIDGLLTDSWEAGAQNWTPTILADFERLRGYDPIPWLPVLAGRVVSDTRRSDAFLFDFRQTLQDLLIANHYGVISDAAQRAGMTYYTEAQGDTPRAIGDGLSAKARSDIPTGEFWYRPFATAPGQPSLVADLKEAASAAHLYGKRFVAAESMTVAAGEDPWAFSPAMLKPVADEIFAHGVNRILIHESHHQPFTDKKPGLTLAFHGQYFNRNDTWAERAKPWVDYLARSSWMLQQGQFVADVLYFYGESENLTQRFEHHLNDEVPPGYGFDYVNAEALLERLSVAGGRIVTDCGMSYALLYIPADVTCMTPPVIEKIDELLRAGAAVVAKKPKGSLGLAGGNVRAAALTEALWGKNKSRCVKVGRGRLYTHGLLTSALTAERLAPDVLVPPEASILSLHRRTHDADIYFLSHRSDLPRRVQMTFRTSGRAADWWSPETGAVRPLGYRPDGDVTHVEMELDAWQSGFVIFHRPGRPSGTVVPVPKETSAQELEGPWMVQFERGRGAPATAVFETLSDWSIHPDPAIRYFSGAAVYSREFMFDRSTITPSARIVMDLGIVHEIATIWLNGQEISTLWHAPYRLDITEYLRDGENLLHIEAINLWPNRLIGDKQPDAVPIAYAPQSTYSATSPLLPSGLIGPVRIIRQHA